MDCTISVAKTKVLISCKFTAQLTFVLVLSYAKNRVSNNVAPIILIELNPHTTILIVV